MRSCWWFPPSFFLSFVLLSVLWLKFAFWIFVHAVLLHLITCHVIAWNGMLVVLLWYYKLACVVVVVFSHIQIWKREHFQDQSWPFFCFYHSQLVSPLPSAALSCLKHLRSHFKNVSSDPTVQAARKRPRTGRMRTQAATLSPPTGRAIHLKMSRRRRS